MTQSKNAPQRVTCLIGLACLFHFAVTTPEQPQAEAEKPAVTAEGDSAPQFSVVVPVDRPQANHHAQALENSSLSE